MPLYLVLLALVPSWLFGIVVGVQGERALCKADHNIGAPRQRVIDVYRQDDGSGSWS